MHKLILGTTVSCDKRSSIDSPQRVLRRIRCTTEVGNLKLLFIEPTYPIISMSVAALTFLELRCNANPITV